MNFNVCAAACASKIIKWKTEDVLKWLKEFYFPLTQRESRD